MQLPVPQEPNAEWQADGWWFHCFHTLIDGGQLARMSGSGCKVYLVIKSHANYKTGLAGPALTTIAAKAGLSLAQVKRELIALGKCGLIRKEKSGRHNVYQIVEHFPLVGSDGNAMAVGRWQYIPARAGAVSEELKRAVAEQSMQNTVLIRIDKVQVQVVQPGGVGLQVGDIQLDTLPPKLRSQFEQLFSHIAQRKAPAGEPPS